MLKELLKDHRLYHSEFQMDNFITIKSGGTDYGQYKQALRELYKRTRGLRELSCDRDKLLVEIEEQKEIAENNESRFKAKYAAIEYKRKSMQLEEADRSIKDTRREFERFYKQALLLKEKVGELTEERIYELEAELFEHKVKELMVTDIFCHGRRSSQTHELLMSLPVERRLKIIEDTTGRSEQESGEKTALLIQNILQENDNFNDIDSIDVDVKKCLLEV